MADASRDARPIDLGGLQARVAELSTISDPYLRMKQAASIARSIEGSPSDSQLAQVLIPTLEAEIMKVFSTLDLYPKLERQHGHQEPVWIADRGYVTAQGLLALIALERRQPKEERRQIIRKLATGLAALSRPDRYEYPFGAHLSWSDTAPFARLDDGTQLPAAFFRADRAYAVEALTEASNLLGNRNLLQSAEREALGMFTHLVIFGEPIRGFSPALEMADEEPLESVLPLVKGFLALYQATEKRLYADLAALSISVVPGGLKAMAQRPEWKSLIEAIEETPAKPLLAATPVDDPISFQIMEAEEGKVVHQAIETVDYESPFGRPGRLAQMGRENTFWMRFDVPTEDDYMFYLNYLQSDVGGGLVSVMMRIDGDRIFQVPLGDVDGRPILRRKFVDGPRPLRAGPHSFGIRFSGLLMTKPALLDSVVVQPAIERRQFQLPNGDRLVLMRNVSDQVARTDLDNFSHWPPVESLVLDGDAERANLGSDEDRRRRKRYMTLPAYGVALIRLQPGRADFE